MTATALRVTKSRCVFFVVIFSLSVFLLRKNPPFSSEKGKGWPLCVKGTSIAFFLTKSSYVFKQNSHTCMGVLFFLYKLLVGLYLNRNASYEFA